MAKLFWVSAVIIIYVWLVFSTHPFCLCLVMIVWLVTREQMGIQVTMVMRSDGVGITIGIGLW